MILDRNKLNFITIQWLRLFFVAFFLVDNTTTWAHHAMATQKQTQQQQSQQLHQQQQQQQQHQQEENNISMQDVTVRNFSPRMDNNEWRPVGRGDPLRNDPTFDYSPPALERVRYWADTEKDLPKTEELAAAIVDAKLKKANLSKNDILLLGISGDDRFRGNTFQHQTPSQTFKNSKGETPVLQPKYTSIRRSYYAHQLPTHLMPPPPVPPIMPTSHTIKPAHGEHRHTMPSFMTSAPVAHMNPYSKHYYSTTATAPWMHHGTNSVKSLSSVAPPHMSHPPDIHQQESSNYLVYARPGLTVSSEGSGHHEMHSPNSIQNHVGSIKYGSVSRKPWIHDLLQKEFIKTQKLSTTTVASSHVETAKSQIQANFEPIAGPTLDTTTTTVSYIRPTANTFVNSNNTTQTTPVYITTTNRYTSPPARTTATTTTTHPTKASTTKLNTTRLLIPNSSNLSYRPTVVPMKMTTDSMFSHYNQPEKPLQGPMYLIIEGHSKVKTYGKGELDPHKPKIVPIIPKREPVVRRGDPNEKRGTPETFNVKHLHIRTEPTKLMSSTTTRKPITMPTIPKARYTTKVTQKPGRMPTTTKSAVITNAATKTFNPSKLIVTTTSTTKKPISTKEPKFQRKEFKSPPRDVKANVIPNALEVTKNFNKTIKNEEPNAMQDFFSLLDSSLDSLLKNNDLTDSASATTETYQNDITKLKPVNANIEGRVSTRFNSILADQDVTVSTTTATLPRETRQIFDYDQLPEARKKPKENVNYSDFYEDEDREEDFSDKADEEEEEYEDDDIEDNEDHEDNDHIQIIKRIDQFVGSQSDENTDQLENFDTFSDLIDDEGDIELEYSTDKENEKT
ncbi:uncharacterized protein ACN2A1_001586 isoform 1-T3 [Glossina fuscipes fuscipes]